MIFANQKTFLLFVFSLYRHPPIHHMENFYKTYPINVSLEFSPKIGWQRFSISSQNSTLFRFSLYELRSLIFVLCTINVLQLFCVFQPFFYLCTHHFIINLKSPQCPNTQPIGSYLLFLILFYVNVLHFFINHRIHPTVLGHFSFFCSTTTIKISSLSHSPLPIVRVGYRTSLFILNVSFRRLFPIIRPTFLEVKRPHFYLNTLLTR